MSTSTAAREGEAPAEPFALRRAVVLSRRAVGVSPLRPVLSSPLRLAQAPGDGLPSLAPGLIPICSTSAAARTANIYIKHL